MVALGAGIWEHFPLAAQLRLANMSNSPLVILTTLFGKAGVIQQIYPLQTSISQREDGFLIEAAMTDGRQLERNFALLLEGALGSALLFHQVRVEGDRGGHYLLRVGRARWFSPLLRAMHRFKTSRLELAREYQALAYRYQAELCQGLQAAGAEAPWEDAQQPEDLYNLVTVALLTFTEDGVIAQANLPARRLLGRALTEDASIYQLLPAAHGNSPLLADRSRGRAVFAAAVVPAYGQVLPVEVTVVWDARGKGRHLCELRDVSAAQGQEATLRALRQQLLASQRAQALGRLNQEVTHDFNNLLLAASSHLDLLQARRAEEEQALAALGSLLDAGKALTQRLLGFAREGEAGQRDFNLSLLVEEVCAYLQRLLPEKMRLELRLPQAELMLHASPQQVEQALVNLVINARDAMPAGGAILITLLDLGDELELMVEDEGTGMDEATLKQIFVPLYTTKPEGQGTGLGLAIVKGLVDELGGTVEVASVPGEGSCFTLRLPKALSSPPDSPPDWAAGE